MSLLALTTSTAFGILEVLGMFLLSIALFRIPYRSYLLHLLAASTLVSIVATLTYDVWDLHFYASELIVAIVSYLVIKAAFKTSLWHTFLFICGIYSFISIHLSKRVGIRFYIGKNGH